MADRVLCAFGRGRDAPKITGRCYNILNDRIMGTLLVIIIIVFLCWPWIKRLMARFMLNRAEDYMRRATGMPPRPGSRQARREQRRASGGTRANSQRTSRRAARHDGPIIPREYAEDVEFTETVDYSSSEIREKKKGNERVYRESQVSDAEWVEIK